MKSEFKIWIASPDRPREFLRSSLLATGRAEYLVVFMIEYGFFLVGMIFGMIFGFLIGRD